MSKRNGTGYQIPETIASLQFEGKHDGLVIRASLDAPFGTALRFEELNKDTDRSAEDVRALMQEFAKFLIEWNIRDRNNDPVPADFDGLMSLPVNFVVDLMAAWSRAMADTRPLAETASE
ncbi:MAG TPA: hypothetical protein VFS30_00580 [Dehalococcoidia bacterium]|nr:hypothetical protein [Dehalococcoidia bacterium]